MQREKKGMGREYGHRKIKEKVAVQAESRMESDSWGRFSVGSLFPSSKEGRLRTDQPRVETQHSYLLKEVVSEKERWSFLAWKTFQ